MRRTIFLIPCLLLICNFVLAQIQISGTVKDNNGEVLIGVSILVVETQKGTSTDFEGKFSIEVQASLLRSLSYIGMYLP